MNQGAPFEANVDRKHSTLPSDGGLGIVRIRMEQRDPGLAFMLQEIERSPEKTEIITQALIAASHDWSDAQELAENAEAVAAFRHLLAHWDTPQDGRKKTTEEHEAEALEFAKKL